MSDDLPHLSDLEHVRKRPAMYVGDRSVRGLHRLFVELLDNAIDQFLTHKVNCVRAEVRGDCLEFADDGPGLPFDEMHKPGQTLASFYLSQLRIHDPTADGHTPHVHLDGYGCGLALVTMLAKTFEVTSWRNGKVWQQRFQDGLETGPPRVVKEEAARGTRYRLTVENEIFDTSWCGELIDARLTDAAYRFPGLRVQSPTLDFCATRGLADFAKSIAEEMAKTQDVSQIGRVWWLNKWFGDKHIQAAVVGHTTGETHWQSFANGNRCTEGGTHLTALKRVVSRFNLSPAVGMIQVLLEDPIFAGPTTSRLDASALHAPIYQALKPELRRFVERA